MKILRPSDDLENMRQRLAEMVGRPAYIAGCAYWQGSDSRYKMPGANRYTHIGSLALYTSQLSDGGRSVRVDEGPPRIRYFDLEPARWVHLMYPLLPSDHPPMPRRSYEDSYMHTVAAPMFKRLGLGCDLGFQTVALSFHDQAVAPELEPFVHSYPLIPSRQNGWAVRFARSSLIEAPHVTAMDWFLGITFDGRDYIGQTIQAPGQYSAVDGAPRKLVEVLPVNRTCLVDADPGQCVICHGSSGERAHFAVVASGQHAYPDGWICRTCFPEVTRRWNEMLWDWKPPARARNTEDKEPV